MLEEPGVATHSLLLSQTIPVIQGVCQYCGNIYQHIRAGHLKNMLGHPQLLLLFGMHGNKHIQGSSSYSLGQLKSHSTLLGFSMQDEASNMETYGKNKVKTKTRTNKQTKKHLRFNYVISMQKQSISH